MKIKPLVSCLGILTLSLFAIIGFAQSKKSPSVSPPRLPMNIPPPPNFASMGSKVGKYQIISAEYYSQDEKAYLYKRLIKFDTTTGEGWVLVSNLTSAGEKRKWVPLLNE
ncbi:MAG: hypothetical protein P8N49_01815 [Opitutales bacterium]|nr:hypothetical protein [Opitutales bacterium]